MINRTHWIYIHQMWPCPIREHKNTGIFPGCAFDVFFNLFGQHQGSFFNVQFARGRLEREFQNSSKLETILCWFQFTCWFETNSHSVSFLVCQLVWVGLWDGGVRWAVVQLGGASWKCAVVQLGVPVEREFSQLRRNERAAGQPPAFDRGTQPHRPSKKKNKKKQPHRSTKKTHTTTPSQPPHQPIQMHSHCLWHCQKCESNFEKF